MQKLIEGVHRFRLEEFGRYRELFHRLSREGQKPHTLFITCADSRVIAELITQSQPGDLFVVKNIGNIVPPSSVYGSTNSTAAAIEFAVEVLEVDDVVVCGHSQCGAMIALLEPGPSLNEMPHLSGWLEIARPVQTIIEAEYAGLTGLDRLTAAAQENVLFALENLHEYPLVARRLQQQKLRLHGWFFEIGTGKLYAYDADSRQFTEIA